MTLTGCATSGINLPPLPVDLTTCFDHTVAKPPKGPLTKQQVIALIGELKLSEAEKVQCGKRLLAFYSVLKAS